jgi:hypothetical protein
MSIYLNFGDGADGDVTISGSFNCHTGIKIVGKSYADAICYNVSSVGSNSVQTTATPNGIIVGDEVVLMTLCGTASNYTNAGNYEFFRVQNVNGSTITFTTSKTKLYGQNGGDTIGSHKVIVQRVPNYNNLTVNNGGTYTGSAFDGNKYGVIVFRVKNELVNNGTITASTLGFRGGPQVPQYNRGTNGESYNDNRGTIIWPNNNLGGGGGGEAGTISYGGGGGYGTSGVTISPGYQGGNGGGTYGVDTLSSLYLGSGGGSPGSSTAPGGSGGAGGGIIMIVTSILKNYNTITNRGSDGVTSGTKYGGGGSGGSTLIHAGTVYFYSSSIISLGGYGGGGNNGGVGRIAVYYKLLGDSLSGINPTPYTSTDVTTPYRISGTLTDPADIYLFRDSDNSYVERITVSGTNYNFYVTNGGYYMVVAKPVDVNKAGAVYTRIQPVAS